MLLIIKKLSRKTDAMQAHKKINAKLFLCKFFNYVFFPLPPEILFFLLPLCSSLTIHELNAQLLCAWLVVVAMHSKRDSFLYLLKLNIFSLWKWQNKKKRLARNHELQYINNSVIYMHVHNDKETPLQ